MLLSNVQILPFLLGQPHDDRVGTLLLESEVFSVTFISDQFEFSSLSGL